jgi:hypothetical protein
MTQSVLTTPRCPVQSSLLAAVGYCPSRCVLDIELRDGALYRYYRVPVYICWNLLCAAAKGRFFNRYIKGAFAYQRLSPPRRAVGAGRWSQPRLRQALEPGA